MDVDTSQDVEIETPFLARRLPNIAIHITHCPQVTGSSFGIFSMTMRMKGSTAQAAWVSHTHIIIITVNERFNLVFVFKNRGIRGDSIFAVNYFLTNIMSCIRLVARRYLIFRRRRSIIMILQCMRRCLLSTASFSHETACDLSTSGRCFRQRRVADQSIDLRHSLLKICVIFLIFCLRFENRTLTNHYIHFKFKLTAARSVGLCRSRLRHHWRSLCVIFSRLAVGLHVYLLVYITVVGLWCLMTRQEYTLEAVVL